MSKRTREAAASPPAFRPAADVSVGQGREPRLGIGGNCAGSRRDLATLRDDHAAGLASGRASAPLVLVVGQDDRIVLGFPLHGDFVRCRTIGELRDWLGRSNVGAVLLAESGRGSMDAVDVLAFVKATNATVPVIQVVDLNPPGSVTPSHLSESSGGLPQAINSRGRFGGIPPDHPGSVMASLPALVAAVCQDILPGLHPASAIVARAAIVESRQRPNLAMVARTVGLSVRSVERDFAVNRLPPPGRLVRFVRWLVPVRVVRLHGLSSRAAADFLGLARVESFYKAVVRELGIHPRELRTTSEYSRLLERILRQWGPPPL